ncbi:MAG: AzlC family ABC transporter permease, partial [Nitratireductor sp.]|nr:AzlC family ABC transporter permease [Nitratireductor sp.]
MQSAASARREFAEGLRDTLPILVAAAPFGIVFGAAAVAAGYSFAETVFTSAAMFAGASQFVFIEVNAQAVPAWMVVLAVFAINFRHILYSASTGRRIAGM